MRISNSVTYRKNASYNEYYCHISIFFFSLYSSVKYNTATKETRGVIQRKQTKKCDAYELLFCPK